MTRWQEYYARNRDKLLAKSASPEGRAKQKARYRADKQKRLTYRLRKQYGLTPVQVDALLLAQGGKCAICARTLPELRLAAIDHDHSTGEVRGVLCMPCNLMLGHAHDSVTVLRAAADYLENPIALSVSLT